MIGDPGSAIDAVETAVVDIPLSRTVGTPMHQISSVSCVLVTITTADGATGTGFCFTVDLDHLRSLVRTVQELGQQMIGRSVFEANPPPGDTVIAYSAIDTAIWDAAGRTIGCSLPELWGQVRDRVDCYASAGFWLSDPVEMLVTDAQRFTEMGFRAVKVRVGHDLATDLERVRIVMRELGPDIAVYTDANQGFDPEEAIRRGLALAEIGVTWFEEPVASHDFAGHAMVRNVLPIDVASGESEYASVGMQAYLDAGAVDILMPDLQRVGGYTEFRIVAAAAAAHKIPLSSHFFTEYSLAIGGSHSDVRTIESIDWFAPLFAETPELIDGQLAIPDRPGHGFSFAPDVVERFGI